jgi:flagellar FliL protein
MSDKEAAADGDDAGKGAGAKQPSPMKLVIVGAVALFVAVLGAQVAAPIVTNMISGGAHATATSDEDPDEGEEGPEVAEQHALPTGPALYVPLDPPFVVSFNDESGDTRFLQLTLQAMARSEHAIAAIKTHAPAIRNAFLFLISAYKVEDLATLEGKEKLRAAMLASANDIVVKNTGEASVEELFFTSLVIQ